MSNNGQWTNSGGALSVAAKSLVVGYRAGTTTVSPAAASLAFTGATPTVSNGSGVSFAQNRPGSLTTYIDRQWDPTDGTITGGVLPPSNLAASLTDSYNMRWVNGDSATGAASQAPIIDTPSNLSTLIGHTIPALPDAHSTAMAIKYRNTWPSGYTPFRVTSNAAESLLLKTLYISLWACMPAGFDSRSNNIKWIFFAGADSGDSRNHVAMLSSDTVGSYMGPWIANQGGGDGGLQYMGGASSFKTGATVNLQNANLPALQGTWVLFEWLMTLETSPGVNSNGICKFWCNNQLRGHWTNLQYNASGDPAGFNRFDFAPYYGGGGTAATSDQYLVIGRMQMAGST